MDDLTGLNKKLRGRKVFLFLDFDGTLSPIVNNPSEASISREMKNTVEQCAEAFHVAIVSGRDLNDLRERIRINDIIYAGSHGFRIKGPEGLKMKHRKSQEIIPDLVDIASDLKDEIGEKISGVYVERKTFAIAVHYRNVDERLLPDIEHAIRKILKKYPDMKTGTGKKIIEIKPALDWNKGRAVEWILESLGLKDDPGIMPMYIGDDITDEDAFRSIYFKGIGILVGHHGKHSAAHYRLKNVDEVSAFLRKLLNQY